jgi:hypothetical protein
MEHIKIDRDTMIQQLVQSTCDHIEMCPETLDSYLTYGFKGFNEYTDDELIAEYKDYVSEDPSYLVTIEIIEEK